MKKEIWKVVPGFNKRYMVSNMGRVKSFYANRVTILRQFYRTDGYLGLALSKNNKSTSFDVHRLVALSFIDGYIDGLEVNHKNCVKDDNRAENLEWVTHKENAVHAFKNGLHKIFSGVNSGMAKITEEDVATIRYLSKNTSITYSEIADIYPIGVASVTNIINRKTWRNI